MPRRITLEDFLQRAAATHGSLYSYAKVGTGELKNPIVIICSMHGDFTQDVNNHLRGQGCKKCATAKSTLSFEEFLEKSHAVHGDTYSYEKAKSNYSKSTSKVKITCRLHGDFLQVAYKHYGGQGCVPDTFTRSDSPVPGSARASRDRN